MAADRLLWIFAPRRLRTGDDRTEISQRLVRSSAVCHDLDAVGLASQQDANHWKGRVCGIVLARPQQHAGTSLDILSGAMRALADYTSATRFRGHPLLQIDILEAAWLADPAPLAESTFMRKAVFNAVSRYAEERLLTGVCQRPPGRTVSDVIADWAARFGTTARNLLDASGRVAASMPAEHALLLVSRRWASWAFPLAAHLDGAAMGLHSLKGWVPQGVARAEDAPAEMELTLETLQSIADRLRELHSMSPSVELAALTLSIQRRRDAFILDSARQSRKAYAMDYLISCVLCGAYLKSATDLTDVLAHAVVATAQQPELREHLLARLREPRPVPSPTSLRRHRLTLHMALCSLQQELHEEMLQSPGGVVTWRTVDSSPQFGWDWVLCGVRMVRAVDLQQAFFDANALCSDDVPDEEKARIMANLAPMIQWRQGVPAAVGSGRSSLRRKVHAIAHAQRLTTQGWPSATSLLNATVSFTGDLGTEARIPNYCAPLASLFGEWVIDAPRDSDGDSGSDRSGAESAGRAPPAFDIQAAEPVHGADEEARVAEAATTAEAGAPAAAAAGDIVAFDFDAGLVDAGVPPPPPPPVADAEEEEGEELTIDFSRSVFVAGLLHIVSNITKDLDKPLVSWEWFVRSLKQVCRLLSRRWTRDRLREHCFSDPALRVLWDAAEFEHFRGQVYEGRWGSVSHAVGEVLARAAILRRGWSKDAFLSRGGVDEDRGEEALIVAIADEAILSERFWAYARMVDAVVRLLKTTSDWGESCACHWAEVGLERVSRHSRRKRFQAAYGAASCPMRTMQAPACAAGFHFELLSRFAETAHTDLLMDPAFALLGEEDRASVLADFARARSHITTSFRLKLSHWRQLPWVLFGLAHWEEERAAECARRALALYASAPPAAPHHWLSAVLCEPGGVGHAQMTLLVSGQRRLVELPFLCAMAARLRFASVTERWIEGRHARAKAVLGRAPHISATHYAFYGALPELEAMSRDPALVARLAEHCAMVRNPWEAVRRMGLERHPAVRRLLQLPGGRKHVTRRSGPKLTEILYHTDAFTLHAPLPDDIRTRCGGRPLGEGGEECDPEGGPEEDVVEHVAGGSVFEELLCKSAVAHVLATWRAAPEAGAEPPIFSLGPKLATSPDFFLTALSAVMDPAPEAHDPALAFNIEAEAESAELALQTAFANESAAADETLHGGDAGGLDMEGSGAFFFEIVSTRLAGARLPDGAPRAPAQSMGIRPLRVRGVRREAREVDVWLDDPDPDGGAPADTMTLMMPMLTMDDLRQLRTWVRKPELSYDFGVAVPADLAEAYATIVPRLCRGSADRPGGPGAPAQYTLFTVDDDPDTRFDRVLRILESHGVCQNAFSDEASCTWELTRFGLDRLRLFRSVSDCAPALVTRRAALADSSAYELASLLADSGWVCSVRGAHPDLAPQDYVDGGEKRWWITPQSRALRPSYMRALLDAPRHGKAVPHFRTEAFYAALLDGTEYVPPARFRIARGDIGEARPPKRRRRRGPVAPALLDADGAGVADETSLDDGSADRPAPGSPTPVLSQSSSRSGAASARSRSTASSSSSSSSSSSALASDPEGSASSAAAPPEAHVGAMVAEPAEPPEPALDEEAPMVLPTGPETAIWKTFKFTPIHDRTGEQTGWEVRCPFSGHRTAGRAACTRTYRFNPHGGRERTERSLKWWCTAAFTSETRSDHTALPSCPPGRELPTLADLAAWQPPAAHVAAVAALEARRALRFSGAGVL